VLHRKLQQLDAGLRRHAQSFSTGRSLQKR
jgi:hypothetical protein